MIKGGRLKFKRGDVLRYVSTTSSDAQFYWDGEKVCSMERYGNQRVTPEELSDFPVKYFEHVVGTNINVAWFDSDSY